MENFNTAYRRTLMRKQAGIGSLFASGAKTLADMGGLVGSVLLAAAAGAGIGLGAGTATLTAHDAEDAATAKKEYDNERLKADQGYLASRIKDEALAAMDARAKRSARVIG